MMIEQTIKFKDIFNNYYYKMIYFIYKTNQNFGLDVIILDDQEILIKIKSILKHFYITIKYL